MYCIPCRGLSYTYVSFLQRVQLVDKMEQYANFGFSYIYEKMEEDPNYFFKETAFLKLFLSFLNDKKEDEEQLEEI